MSVKWEIAGFAMEMEAGSGRGCTFQSGEKEKPGRQ